MTVAVVFLFGVAGGSLSAAGNPIAGASLALAGILPGIYLGTKSPPPNGEAER